LRVLGRAIGPGHYLRGWHATATIGAFSSTAVAARLWGLNSAQLQMAWGLAASQMSGLVRNFGSMTKPFHAGNAAQRLLRLFERCAELTDVRELISATIPASQNALKASPALTR
jgi:2-methylcitrate dehydratase PrpD